jgi:hypothetical protein
VHFYWLDFDFASDRALECMRICLLLPQCLHGMLLPADLCRLFSHCSAECSAITNYLPFLGGVADIHRTISLPFNLSKFCYLVIFYLNSRLKHKHYLLHKTSGTCLVAQETLEDYFLQTPSPILSFQVKPQFIQKSVQDL